MPWWLVLLGVAAVFSWISVTILIRNNPDEELGWFRSPSVAPLSQVWFLGGGAVSYTHLDVYKRQPLIGRSGRSPAGSRVAQSAISYAVFGVKARAYLSCSRIRVASGLSLIHI